MHGATATTVLRSRTEVEWVVSICQEGHNKKTRGGGGEGGICVHERVCTRATSFLFALFRAELNPLSQPPWQSGAASRRMEGNGGKGSTSSLPSLPHPLGDYRMPEIPGGRNLDP